MRPAIYIDDTGTPGQKAINQYSNFDNKTWLAVIFNADKRMYSNTQMIECIDELKKKYNATEFHFTDIYSGKKEFEKIDFKDRLNLFYFFADIIRFEQFPMLMQSFSFDDYSRIKLKLTNDKIKIDNFVLNDNYDFALLFLLQRIKLFLNDNKTYNLPIDLIIDEGKQKKNSIQKSEFLKGYLYKDVIQYKSSKDEPLLQIDDFAAFCMNRCKWILSNNSKKEIDIEFLKICEFANFNILNIKREIVRIDENSAKKYDEILGKAFQQNDNYPEIDLETLKNQIK